MSDLSRIFKAIEIMREVSLRREPVTDEQAEAIMEVADIAEEAAESKQDLFSEF